MICSGACAFIPGLATSVRALPLLFSGRHMSLYLVNSPPVNITTHYDLEFRRECVVEAITPLASVPHIEVLHLVN